MSSQDRKYFRFCIGLSLLFLFISSAKTSSSPKSCLDLAVGMMKSQTDDGDTFTTEFDKYLTQCLASVDWQQLIDYSIKNLQKLFEKIPTDMVEFAVKEAVLRTSVFLIQSTYELFKRAVKLSEDEKQYRGRLEELEKYVKDIRNYTNEALNSNPESQDSTTMYETIAEILKMVQEFYTDLEQLTQGVHNDSIKSQEYRGLAVLTESAAIAICGGSLILGGRVIILFTCTLATLGLPFSIISYFSLGETYGKLNQTREDAKKLRIELGRLRIKLQITRASMKGSTSTVYVDIHILSGGCDDPGRSNVSNTCGFSYIEVNGKDFSPHGRGYNVVVVDGKTGEYVKARAFDTFGSSSSGDHLREYLNSLNGNEIVLVAIQEEGSKFVKSALDALKRLGATDPLMPNYRGSFALVGCAGENKPPWIAQKIAKRGLGPSQISLKIPLASK